MGGDKITFCKNKSTWAVRGILSRANSKQSKMWITFSRMWQAFTNLVTQVWKLVVCAPMYTPYSSDPAGNCKGYRMLGEKEE